MDDDRYAVDSQYTFQNHYVMYDYRQVTCQQYTVKKLHQVWRLTDFRIAELNIANQKPIGRHHKRRGF